MENPLLNRLASALWSGIVVLMVLLAIYVSVGRMLAANVAGFRTEILQELNARLPFIVETRQLSGEWHSFTPIIVLKDLRLRLPGSSDPPLELTEGRIGVDVLNSLRTRSLQMSRVVLTDLSLRGEMSSAGVLSLTGFGGGSEDATRQLQLFLLNVEMITLRNNRLILAMPNGEVRDLGLDLQLSREGSLRSVDATLSSSKGARISVLAQGVGDPFRPELFSGQAYFNVQTLDLGAVKDLLSDGSLPVWADGSVDLQLWLDWDKGNPLVTARLAGRDLLVAAEDSSWQVPLDRVSLEAQLLHSENRWSIFVADLRVNTDDVELLLPRLQLDKWQNNLRIRASDVPLEPINTLVLNQEAIPENLRKVFAALHPRGHLSALQVSIGEIDQPTVDWDVEANFEEFAVDSFNGAPGITAATGYTQIAPGSGVVVLDSQLLSLDFPAIYHEALHFEDLHGTLHLDWDAETFRIASGLLTTQGEEGTAKVLFGLNIPLVSNDIGIEMDLLVGLQNSHPIHRLKYIPYVLDPSLRTWLSDSIGAGSIEQGAFLWRGSLKHGAPPLHTIQLAFNIADTDLRYHPQWPAVLVQQGVVLIDDSAVSVWADRARLLESTVEPLSVETRLNAQNQIMLAVEGTLVGPAADALKVLNESAMTGIVGSAFAAWIATGNLETDLALRMNLGDKSVAPQVDIATRWRDVDLQVVPGNLTVQAVSGEFDYSSSRGFSSTALAGKLWGNAVSASLEQGEGASGERYDPATSVLDIKLTSEVEIAEVLRWLQSQPLAFVTGQTTVDAVIRLAPGEPPLLTVNSELQGVRLDLPEPWQKSAEESRHLHLELPLAGVARPLSLDLGEQLKLRLDVADGVVRGGAVGTTTEPLPAPDGVPMAFERAHWSMALTSDWLRGVLSAARDGSPTRLQIEHLDLDRLPDFKLPDHDSEAAQDFPVVDVTLSNVFQSGQRLGELSFELHGEGGVFTADRITGELAKLRLRAERSGRLVWQRGEEGHTELQASLNFEDLGQTLEYFDYQRIVETGGGNFEVDLRWPGSPQDFSLRQAQGTVQVAIGQGSFLEATSGASGALRVVSILNLADIVRRLSLTQMFESGIPFESVEGAVELHDGMLEVARMDVKGSSSFQFSGVSNVQNKSLNGELVATLPVARNLPWIAALAASLPVAAGVYVISKVFDEQLKLLSSAVYTIGGTWNDPQVTFNRVFDNVTQPAVAMPVPVQSGSP